MKNEQVRVLFYFLDSFYRATAGHTVHDSRSGWCQAAHGHAVRPCAVHAMRDPDLRSVRSQVLPFLPVGPIRDVGRAEPIPKRQKVGVAPVTVRMMKVVPSRAAVEYAAVERVVGQVEARVRLDSCTEAGTGWVAEFRASSSGRKEGSGRKQDSRGGKSQAHSATCGGR